jgi:hypothetical protein
MIPEIIPSPHYVPGHGNAWAWNPFDREEDTIDDETEEVTTEEEDEQ